MSWTIEIPGRPVSLNTERNGNRYDRARATKPVRDAAHVYWLHARSDGAPRKLDAIAVTARQLATDGRWLQDIGNCYPAAKAAIDGLVDAGLIPDDTAAHLVALTFLPPAVVGRDALEITVTNHGEGTS